MIKLTLKDIANHFSVSISTVSKALHDSHEISDKLKHRIQEFAKENHYRPNKVALNLVNRSTKSIGVVIPDILNYFFIQVLYGVEKVANERGYSIISCVTDHSLKKETMTLEMLSSGSVDGLIISSVASERQTSKHIENVKSIVDYQIPLVMFDRVIDAIECDKVIVDDFEAGYKATKYLLETGCKTIAIITPINKTKIGRLRIGGYKRALKERDIPFDDKLITPIGAKDDLDFILSFILNDKNIDGILVLDEITTVKTMAIIKARGYHVPNDIAIIGFTNGQLSKYVTPALTMVSQHGTYIGETCAHRLIDRIEGLGSPGNFETKVVKTSLIVRESTRKIPLG
ncbi:LacI family DNA-binding transcriptional regulator [Maribacter sp. ANRC-HE7]|uniref:LacI family DNA-binding transcriptional regulator n=1 Tax=Maribacter aquimaris TaxID=2737171 RepID=A0ABR7V5H0_9FLAO|nr:LacI family DNA-binding transcriptional regulator [Maribacter aquimaris]MBD0778427.1 LacI family DNA-binding transcriptional regulator [Maribacter aquimaris]